MNIMQLVGEGRFVLNETALAEKGENTALTLVHVDDTHSVLVSEIVLSGRLQDDAIAFLLTLPGGHGPEIVPANIGLPHPLHLHGYLFDPTRDGVNAEIAGIRYVDVMPDGDLSAGQLGERLAVLPQTGWDEDAAAAAMTPSALSLSSPA